MNNYVIQNIQEQDLKVALRWAELEGWNPGLNDARSFYLADSLGFFMGFLDSKPIASISAVNYDDTFGFLGLYIVKKEYRHQSFGFKIWQKALNHLGKRNIGLDGVIEQQENYKKSGFQFFYRNVRHEGVASSWHNKNPNLRQIHEISFEEVLRFDRLCFPASRKSFLKEWTQNSKAFFLGYVCDEKLQGYGVIRACKKGYKVGPLFAENEHIAHELFLALSAKYSGEKIYIDVPDINSKAQDFARGHGLNPVFECARMYTQKMPKVCMNQVFGNTTLELG